jgi:ferrochelatase
VKLAVVLFNLGGPDAPDAVAPFLQNLFSDPAIIDLPGFVRKPLAKFIARRRAPVAQEIYARIGGRSPILPETEAQARALEAALKAHGLETRCFIAMRYWKPFSDETARAVAAWKPDRIVLLPLYPQFSTTTTGSSLADWRRAAKAVGLTAPTSRICCYPWDKGFVSAAADQINEALAKARAGISYRLLLTAHGLPEKIIQKGDPYAWQIEESAKAIVGALNRSGLDWVMSYQSRVGPLKWIGPATDEEVRRAGREGKGLIVAPIAFVSEHSETLVELDLEYRKLAQECGVPDYVRAPTVSIGPSFINGLAELAHRAVNGEKVVTCGAGRLCPAEFSACGYAL